MYARPVRYVDGLPRPDRCLVMGVVNVTPDSFSDGGRYLDADVAVKHGLGMLADGADLLDVGGESTRPGAVRPTEQEERERVLPVVAALAEAGAVVSVDTMRASIADDVLRAGARVINDVSGGLADPEMYAVVADHGAAYILMHWRGHADRMQKLTRYDALVPDVIGELATRIAAARSAGVERIAIDPGIGFAKTFDQNWELLAGIEQLHALDHPVLIATSRKGFLGALLAGPEGTARPAARREDATTATSALAAAAGAWCIRTHTPRSTRDAVEVQVRWARG
ncbi:MAG: dihydropteroate synthase [Nocardioidaceae bacterium]